MQEASALVASASGGGFQKVDLLLDGIRVSGRYQEPSSGARLVDVLIGRREQGLPLLECSLYSLAGSLLQESRELEVQVASIFVVVPHETPDAFARRRLDRTGLMLPDRRRLQVAALMPPFVASGHIHLNLGMGLSLHTVPAFFALTEVSIVLGASKLYSGEVAFLNRDRVAGLSEIRAVAPTSDDAALAQSGDLVDAVP